LRSIEDKIRWHVARALPSARVMDGSRPLDHASIAPLDPQVHRMHHPTRTATAAEVTATNVLVGEFEVPKQKSNSATKNVTILLPGARGEGHK